MEIHTIGFTQTTAERFFETLKQTRIQRLIDIRLNNRSQLAGFAKRDDLRYFLKSICGAEYLHEPLLAPTQEILDAYKKKRIAWDEYERQFLALLRARKVEQSLRPSLFDTPAVLLCSEPKPDRCHRRLVAEYLSDTWGGIAIRHLCP